MVPPLLLSLAMTQSPVYAQTRPMPPAASAASAPDGAFPGKQPKSSQASNIEGSDTHTLYAPELPQPAIGADSTPRDLVSAAEQALAEKHTGVAQQALEMAETRLLDRTVPVDQGSVPDSNPMVAQITRALHLLGQGDIAGARQVLKTVLAAQ
jgi:hypothetical protein